MIDRLRIREVVENWAVWRDAGDWDRFRSVWHPDGRMMATWFQGSTDDFIRVPSPAARTTAASGRGWVMGPLSVLQLGGEDSNLV